MNQMNVFSDFNILLINLDFCSIFWILDLFLSLFRTRSRVYRISLIEFQPEFLSHIRQLKTVIRFSEIWIENSVLHSSEIFESQSVQKRSRSSRRRSSKWSNHLPDRQPWERTWHCQYWSVCVDCNTFRRPSRTLTRLNSNVEPKAIMLVKLYNRVLLCQFWILKSFICLYWKYIGCVTVCHLPSEYFLTLCLLSCMFQQYLTVGMPKSTYKHKYIFMLNKNALQVNWLMSVIIF